MKLVTTIIFAIVSTLNSIACSCKGQGTVSGNIKNSDAVFSGEVISKVLTTNYDSLGIVVSGDTSKMYFKWHEFPSIAVRIKIDRMYKGQLVSDTLTILTPPNGSSCGFHFEVGQKYIVYSSKVDKIFSAIDLERRSINNQTFWTHQCTRTQYWNSSEEDEILEEKNRAAYNSAYSLWRDYRKFGF